MTNKILKMFVRSPTRQFKYKRNWLFKNKSKLIDKWLNQKISDSDIKENIVLYKFLSAPPGSFIKVLLEQDILAKREMENGN